MRYEKIKETLDLLVGAKNLGFVIYDINGNEISGFAHLDGERDSRGVIVILDKEDLILFFPRNPEKYFKKENLQKITPADGTYQTINHSLIGHIKMDIWGWNEFLWQNLHQKSRDFYFIIENK